MSVPMGMERVLAREDRQPGRCVRERRHLAVWLTVVLAAGCTSAGVKTPVPEGSPRERARRVYRLLVERERPGSTRSPDTLAGFPEAPPQVSVQLQALAKSKPGGERAATLALAEALSSSGYYSVVIFHVDFTSVKVKYRLIARDEALAAHTGENRMPIGFYYIWTERDGRITSPIDQYEIVEKRIHIHLPEYASPRR